MKPFRDFLFESVQAFHGTGANFDIFDMSHGGEATGATNGVLGIFFTTEFKKADELYAGRRGTVIEATITLRNPIRLKGLEYDADASAAVNQAASEYCDKHRDDLTTQDFREYREFLERQGHDGIEVHLHHGDTDYIVFSPAQITNIHKIAP
jgi:hypothetical protein